MGNSLFGEPEHVTLREFKVRFEDAVEDAESFSKEPGREKYFIDNKVITSRYNILTFIPR